MKSHCNDLPPGISRGLQTILAVGLIGLACVVLALTFGGCAAGRGPAGEIIIGWDVAKLPETAGELANAAAGFLPPPWNLIAGAGALALTGYAAKKKGEDRGWDMAAGVPPQANKQESNS